MSNPFQNWTEADVAAFNARARQAGMPELSESSIPGADDERQLHEQISAECRRRGWIALHGAMSERTARNLGEWDYEILADGGRVFLIELKSRTGKLRPEQAALHHWAAKLGHKSHVVRSVEQFLEIINEKT